MKGVLQTRNGAPNGNCWEAALASILEFDLDKVPDGRPEKPRPNMMETQAFLLKEGYLLCSFYLSAIGLYPESPAGSEKDEFYMLTGAGTSGLPHTVVMKQNQMAWDPANGASSGVPPIAPPYILQFLVSFADFAGEFRAGRHRLLDFPGDGE